MIFVLVPLRWRNVGAPSPPPHRDADVFSYWYVAPMASVFLTPSYSQPEIVAAEPPTPDIPPTGMVFLVEARVSVFVVPSTRSVYP